MGHLSEQYPTDQKEEEKHESYLSKKKKGVLKQVHIESESETILFFNPHKISTFIWCSSELLLLNCMEYLQILKMLFQIY